MTRPIQTLLLVDDFAPDRELYRRCLMSDANCVYCLLEADSATAGLELCRTQAIDAILLDYSLPDQNGIEFLQALYEQSNGGSPPVVMVTGEGDERVAVQAIKLGAEDYLVKRHLTPEQLQVTMRSAIENAQLRRQLQQSDDRFRVSVDNMLDCFGLCSAIRNEAGQITDFRIDYLNVAAMQDTQLTAADLGRGLCEIFPAHYETGLFDDYCRVVETGKPLARENIIYADHFGTQHLTRAYDIRASQWGDGFVVSWRDITEKKRTESALQESERRLREIFNTTFQFVGLLSPEGIVLEANQTALDFGGLTREEVVGRPFWNVRWWTLSSETQQQLQEAIARAAQGEFIRYEVEVLGVGETTTIIDFSLKPVRDESGQVVLLIPEGRNISDRVRYERDRKLQEQRLRESEEQLKLGVQVAGVALARFDYTTHTVQLSPEAAALYGIDALSVSRDRLHATFHPDEREEMARIIQQAIEPSGGGWFAREHRVVWQNGEVRWLSVRKQVFFDRSGETPRPDYAILAAIDITDRKRTEAALLEEEQRFRAIIDNSKAAIFMKDAQGRYLLMNRECERLLNLTSDWICGKTDYDVFPAEVADRVRTNDQKVLEAGEAVRLEEEVPLEDGMHTYVAVKFPLLDSEGKPYALCGVSTDITDRVRLQSERDQLLREAEAAREAAEAANRSKDEFVAVVAHELRSPLNSIQGWAKLLQSRKFDEGTLSKALDTIVRNTEAQVQLVEDLLDISRLVRGTLTLNLAPVNLASVIEAALDIVRPQAQVRGIALVTELMLPPQISGDFNRLQQIAINLLTNAIKFTPDGGQVEVRLESVETQVQLCVRDTGKGIAPEFLPQIFERFQQGQQNTGSKDGLGLGLAIVKNLVELHHGTITAASPGIDQGSTFTVQFPRLSTSAIVPEQASSIALEPASLAGIRILIVDDEPDQLDLITFVLEEAGAEVRSATNAIAALETLIQFNPDLLISDLAMPEANGYELLQQARLHPQGEIPAIVLTAYASTTHQERSLQAGFQRHLTKPVEPEELVIAILNLVGGRKS